jgi:20S proteasome subunit alpha 7
MALRYMSSSQAVSSLCVHPTFWCRINLTRTPKGYHGAAVGKGRQLAKTELEKLKLSELTAREAVIEAARMYVLFNLSIYFPTFMSYPSIYLVHEDAKEKEFELEMSWIGPETNGQHVAVPKDLFDEAEAKAKEALVSGLE